MRRLPLDQPEVEPATLRAWEIHSGSPVADPSELRSRLAHGSLPEAIGDTAQRRGRQEALRVRERSVTHGELDQRAARAAGGISRLGGGPDTTVMLIADVGIEEIAAYLGALRVGATVVLANPTLTAGELSRLAANSGARWVLGSGPALSRSRDLSGGEVVEIVGLREEDAGTSTAQLDSVATTEVEVREIAAAAPAILAFTSGSTGRPKPTPLTHANLLASVRGVMSAWRWAEGDHLVHALPISHQHGLSGVHATLLAGSRATLLGSLDAEALLDAVEGDGATIHFGVPAIYQRVLHRLGPSAAGLSRLRLAVSGSGPLPVDLAEAYLSVTGAPLLERYGTTESGLDVSHPYDGRRAPGRVGLPLPGVEIALVEERGDLATEGSHGEVLIRGPQVFDGYLGVPASEQPFFEGWFATGDIGTVDGETGYLRIVGRKKEVIISGGMNVYPQEVEEVIRALPAVTDVAVVGVESSRWGEEVVAVVSPAAVDPAQVIASAASDLAPYKRPKRVIPVDQIPRSPVGKVDQQALRSLIPPSDSAGSSGGIGSAPQIARRD